jgi:hypothetical protein
MDEQPPADGAVASPAASAAAPVRRTRFVALRLLGAAVLLVVCIASWSHASELSGSGGITIAGGGRMRHGATSEFEQMLGETPQGREFLANARRADEQAQREASPFILLAFVCGLGVLGIAGSALLAKAGAQQKS